MFKIEDGQSLRYMVIVAGEIYKQPLEITREDKKLVLDFGFCTPLRLELKASLAGMHFCGYDPKPRKVWTCNYDDHNRFRLAKIIGANPYSRYSQALTQPTPLGPNRFPLRLHQVDGVQPFLMTRRALWAYEMGLGKSLMAIVAIEKVRPKRCIWVAPRSALLSVRLEYEKWGCTVPIEFMTYEGLKKLVANFKDGDPAPDFVVGDESQKLKTWTSERTQSFRHLTTAMRREHGYNCYILLMSGTPAPRTPVDWYSQCEIIEPGFLREGDQFKFKERLCLSEQKENTTTGGVYPEILTWYDDSKKCNKCGRMAEDIEHDIDNANRHDYIPSTNEVEKLYSRMNGLVFVKTKKDCTDLPDKIYQRIYCKPTHRTLESMRLISKSSPSAIMALTRMRELSDGFQYVEEASGTCLCPACEGKKELVLPAYIGPDKTLELIQTLEPDAVIPEDPLDFIIDPARHPQLFDISPQPCPTCDAIGQVTSYIRTDKQFPTSKDKALIDLLEEYDDVGRVVIYAGFAASVQKIVELVSRHKWEVIKLDGSGWFSTLPGSPETLIKAFQGKDTDGRRIAFVGNQGAASSGLTLTASPVIIYYSNTFNGEDRMQSEDRIHRIGMDVNRGAKIIDLVHLPTDEYVLDNIQKKKNLQNMSLGQLQEAMSKERDGYDYDEN